MRVLENGSIQNDGNYLALNGRGYGDLGALASYSPVDIGNNIIIDRNDPGFRRPFRHPKTNKPWVVVNTGRTTIEKGVATPIKEAVPVDRVVNGWGISNEALVTANATALLPLIWRQLDEAILKEPRLRLRAYADLQAANPVGGFDAYASSTYETQLMSDPGEAVMSMSSATEDERNDSAKFGLSSVPLPITSAGFKIDERQLSISRKGGRDTAFDTAGAEWCGRRVSETVEKRTIGLGQPFAFGTQTTGVTAHVGTSAVWGYLDFPFINSTSAITAGNAGGWTPATFINELLTALETLAQDRFPGPFMLYNSTDWDQLFDGDYWTGTLASGLTTPSRTLRDRIKAVEKIQDVRRLDFLEATGNPYTIILVDMSGQSARAINGRGITTIQYATKGGAEINFIVYCIWVPLMRASLSGRCGILVGT